MADLPGDTPLNYPRDYPINVERQLLRLNTRIEGDKRTVLPREQWWGDADSIRRGAHKVLGFQEIAQLSHEGYDTGRRAYGPEHPGVVNMRRMYNLPAPEYKPYAPAGDADAHHVQGRQAPHAGDGAGHAPAAKPRGGMVASFLQGLLRR